MLHKFIPQDSYIKAEQFDGSHEQIKRWHIRVSEYKDKKYYWLPKGDWAEEQLYIGDWIWDDPDDVDGGHFYCSMPDKSFKKAYQEAQ
jgi:hypothetical protein